MWRAHTPDPASSDDICLRCQPKLWHDLLYDLLLPTNWQAPVWMGPTTSTDPEAWYAKCFSQVAAKPISSCLRHCLTLPDHGPWEMPDGYGMARHGPDQLSSNILKPLIDTYRHSRCVRWYKSMMSMVTYRRIRRPYSRPGPIVSGHHQPSQWICLCSLVQGADGVHQWNFWGFECLMVLSAIAWEQVFSMPK